ncbi:hypothetical protein BJ875DRAFT_265049 [Amylocarpus encephaloides]|uniref:Uncharacterized protein n=1 Tax=Amylocarpus encephaloides TaxID=45428 RepID=A0A9P8C6G5_9HELO|nr:hypothetical protein BJ875DRAFT_265049 [Amylocarpus encephaloides]
MSKRVLRPQSNVCQLCDLVLSRKTLRRPSNRASKPSSTTRFFTNKSTCLQRPQKSAPAAALKFKAPNASAQEQPREAVTAHEIIADLEKRFGEVKDKCDTLLTSENIPSDEETLNLLKRCEGLSQALAQATNPQNLLAQAAGLGQMESKGKKNHAASGLLELDLASPYLKSHGMVQRMQHELSTIVTSVVTHPPVFITPAVLDIYVNIQAHLKKPEGIAGIFHLYANKPLPEEGSPPIKYLQPKPDKIANAINKHTADRALNAAIDSKNLIAAMDLIEFSYTAIAYRRAKFVRAGLLPATGLGLAPLAAYTLASQLGQMQTTMEPGMATKVAFVGMIAYIGFTATIGIVAITTANDQMDRVTWTPGMPLRERWIREDERAAIDKVAGAWGFREAWRRGEEEGEEWDALREWMGMKGMILDRTELMEGME